MKRLALLLLVLLAIVCGGLVIDASKPQVVQASPTVYIGDGGANWSCTDVDAAAGKTLYGYGDEGVKYYRCVHKDWTFDGILYSWGNYYWQHNSSWPFIVYANRSAWQGT